MADVHGESAALELTVLIVTETWRPAKFVSAKIDGRVRLERPFGQVAWVLPMEWSGACLRSSTRDKAAYNLLYSKATLARAVPMCGRFVRAKMPEVYAKTFDLMGVPSMPSSWNVAPTQPVLAVRMEEERKACAILRWGLIPFWAKDKKTSYINARAETVLEKPAFKAALKRRRCLVLADGYYEWKALGPKKKQPFYFRLKDDAPFAFAGIWDTWSKEERPIESCTIITTSANELSQPIHDRMPVMLCGADAEAWLDPAIEDLEPLAQVLKPFSADRMTCYEVGPLVGNVKNNRPECVEPAPPDLFGSL